MQSIYGQEFCFHWNERMGTPETDPEKGDYKTYRDERDITKDKDLIFLPVNGGYHRRAEDSILPKSITVRRTKPLIMPSEAVLKPVGRFCGQ